MLSHRSAAFQHVGVSMILKGKVALITASIQRIQFYQWNNDCGRWRNDRLSSGWVH